MAETVIGRSSRCRVVLHDTRVSSLHAQLRWQGSRWQVLDVSRNGTWVDTAPLVSVFVDPDGEAFLESADHRTLLCDGAEFEVAGRHYQVQLARSEPPTTAIGASLEDAQLTLAPARHEEHVAVTLTLAGRTRTLRSRVHFCLLLELARQRLSDRRRGLPTGSEGWVYMDEMCQRLRIDRPTFNTYAHRLRKQFGELELVDAVNIVERRVDSDEVRIGCANLVVE